MNLNPWTLLLSLLGNLLSFFYDILPEYGISIILLTLTVSLLLFPLTLKQTKSMRAMQEIQPEVKRLQKEFKGEKEELNKHLMALYQERGVNPAAGCLPLLIQMPIWFALYRVLWKGAGIPEGSTLSGVISDANDALYTVDASGNLTTTLKDGVDILGSQFEHVTFLGMNLMVRPSQGVDFSNIPGSLPYIILIAIIVAAGFYQQVQTTRKRKGSNNDTPQTSQMAGMQNAMKIMPVVFGFISWNFVTGLGLYFATSNVFRVGQQAFILRSHGGDEAQGKGAESSTPDDPSDEPTSDGPSPNASKKRNRKRRK
ncbi:MAG: YidC/Oxa1 family membrane protein insertase [Acidimicrobiia bacterium]|nr:MAG: YidC/Oxa1 family membrane protein insertase [Acidimicrobiia bacterium]